MKVEEESMYLREVLNSKMVVLNKRRQSICMCLKLDDNKAENKMPHIFWLNKFFTCSGMLSSVMLAESERHICRIRVGLYCTRKKE